MREALLFSAAMAAEPLWWQVAGLCALFTWLGVTLEARTYMKTQIDFSGLEGYQTDEDKELHSGVWVPFPGGHSVRILRAGPSNKSYSRAMQSAFRPYRRQIEQNTMDNEVAERLLRGIYVRHIIKDWSGFKDAAGNEVSYDPETADELLAALPQLFSDIQAFASDFATFQNAQVEEAKDTLGES